MGAHADPFFKTEINKTLNMKKGFPGRMFKRFGRKALIIYLCWCVVKGILFMIIGFKLFN